MSVPRRILLVESDHEQAFLFAQLLAMGGYQVVTVRDVEAAQQRLAEACYDLVLAEWCLPGMRGDTLICAVNTRCPTVKTILMGNDDQVGVVANACGADAWFCKHTDLLQLRSLVARVLEGQNSPG